MRTDGIFNATFGLVEAQSQFYAKLKHSYELAKYFFAYFSKKMLNVDAVSVKEWCRFSDNILCMYLSADVL